MQVLRRPDGDLDFEVEEGAITGLIGPNGSGKTTTLNLLAGFLKPDSGTITFTGENVTGLPRCRVCQKGIARTFQLIKPFLDFTALQNEVVSRAHGHEPAKTLELAVQDLRGILEQVGLRDKAQVTAKDFTLMQRKRVGLGRALATGPQLLLLDDLMAGLDPGEAEDAMRLVKQIRDSGITIVVVEHIVKAILGLSDHIIVLNMGEKIAEGSRDRFSMIPKSYKSTWVRPMPEMDGVDAYHGDLQALWGGLYASE